VTKKLTWEVDKTSLVLKVTDGAKETTWKIRKSTKIEDLRTMLEEMQLALWDSTNLDQRYVEEYVPQWTGKPMIESVRTVDAEELAELQRYQHNETSEEESRAAQAAEARRFEIGARWFDVDDDETYGIPIPDYDTGEVEPR
jgi:hypothetical protein